MESIDCFIDDGVDQEDYKKINRLYTLDELSDTSGDET
jgi:hypothetical protein